MAEQMLYPGDTICLKSDSRSLGVVDRTNGNVDTHTPDPSSEYVAGIERSKRVSKRLFKKFLRDGIPPRGTVLVSWIQLPWQKHLESTLIPEQDLKLIEREFCVGDIVKRSPRDPMSGSITQAYTTVNLLQPLPWSEATPDRSSREKCGNFPKRPTNVLKEVPADDLIHTKEFMENDFLLFDNWVGKIMDMDEEVFVRLDGNRVVIPEDPEDLETSSTEDFHQVGDFVTTRKANLRRGRWVYGEFNANVEPSGFVADVRPNYLQVQWRSSRYPTGEVMATPEPPTDIDTDHLASGDVHLYDRRCLPHSSSGRALRRLNMDVCAGDRVRFRDIRAAAAKNDINGKPAQSKISYIPKTESLGYDVNVFLVIETTTQVDIIWQDGNIDSGISVKELVPHLDLDGGDEVWPGELVATRQNVSDIELIHEPRRVGVVQTVNANDRLATVKWFVNSRLMATVDDTETLLPGSYTGRIESEAEEVSLYDIWAAPGMPRRLGDMVIIIPPLNPDRYLPSDSEIQDVLAVLSKPSQSKDWFGEIIELGLDGLLTIRLGASDVPRDVKVPWECTYLVYSSDLEDAFDDEFDDGSVEASSEADSAFVDEDIMEGISTFTHSDEGLNYQRSDESDEWTTDEDEEDDKEMEEADTDQEGEDEYETDDVRSAASVALHEATNELDPPHEDILMDDAQDPVYEPHPSDPVSAVVQSPQASESETPSRSSSTSGYSTLLSQVEQFAILDGSPPPDYHWYEREAVPDNKTLRRIHKEHKILQTSLPEGAFARTWESALDKMRVFLLGPLDTPYEYAPFIFDILFDTTFPHNPPHVFFHSWTDNQGPCNPNLYEDGKVCLSLLGTWPGDEKNESWSPSKSTVLQVIVSLLGLVLVKEPYYNEAGFEVRVGTVESSIPSRLYSERTFFRTRSFISRAIRSGVGGFEQEIKTLYLGSDGLLQKAISTAIDVVHRSRPSARKANGAIDHNAAFDADLRKVSPGALVPLTRQIEDLLSILRHTDTEAAELLLGKLKS